MRLFLMTALVMVAFAANSVLNRAALLAPEIDALTFAWIRTAAGAAALLALVAITERGLPLRGPLRLPGAASLAVYMLGFSMAYVAIDTGVGALILFGGAQVTMFVGARVLGEAVPPARWLGAVIALVGLAWLCWPTQSFAVSPRHAALMLAAGLGWGIYSLVGRRAGPPLRASAANFLLATPVCIVAAWALSGSPDTASASQRGVALALVSGVVTSAMAYALWYAVLPQLKASVAGLAMVTVPVIALAGGVVFLGEGVSLKLVLSSALVLSGVALGVLAPQIGRPARQR